MKLTLIVSSLEIHLLDLAVEFVRKGHELTVLVPSSEIQTAWLLEEYQGVKVLKLKIHRFNKFNNLHRLISELMMPYTMKYRLKKSPFCNDDWDGIIWYSPSIFHGPLVSQLKKRDRCKRYLILRDIFPQWTVDVGLLKHGLIYKFLLFVAHYQYSLADIIGIQTPSNDIFLENWLMRPNRKIEVLPNWLGEQKVNQCTIRVSETILKGRKIFVYAGNMGRAQSLDIFIRLAQKMIHETNIGFLFVGQGSEMKKLKELSSMNMLPNILFFDVISEDQIPALFFQCTAGIVSLDHKHKTHNIPGKFLAYLRSGLPILANINPNNDLVKLIYDDQIGEVCVNNNINDLAQKMLTLIQKIENDPTMTARCRNVFENNYTVDKAYEKIINALSS